MLVTCSKAPCPQWGAIIRDDLRKIGIGVTVVESADFFPKEPYDLHFLFWGPDYPDPANVLNPLLLGNQSPPRGVNFSYFDNPVYNRRLEAAAELTGPAREAAYARLDADLTGKEASGRRATTSARMSAADTRGIPAALDLPPESAASACR